LAPDVQTEELGAKIRHPLDLEERRNPDDPVAAAANHGLHHGAH